jgi:hypothetical protein
VRVDAVTVVLRIADDLPVVDANAQPMLSRRERTKIEFVRRFEAAFAANLFIVHPHRRLPVRTLQE